MSALTDPFFPTASAIVLLVACATPIPRSPLSGVERVGRTNAYVCGTWQDAPAPRGRQLLDIDAPREEIGVDSLALAVSASGGEVVHRYGIARVRARMDVGAATRLSGWVSPVTDSTRHNVLVWVSIPGPMPSTDSAALAVGGATLVGQPGLRGPTRLYLVILPDSLLPRLRAVRGVGPVQSALFCVTSAGGPGLR